MHVRQVATTRPKLELYCPAAHVKLWHTVEPVVAVNVAGTHGAQAETPVAAENVPARQEVHVALVTAPTVAENKPATHPRHFVLTCIPVPVW